MLSGKYRSLTEIEEDFLRRILIDSRRPSLHFYDVLGVCACNIEKTLSGNLEMYETIENVGANVSPV